jgi:hypothetical protein
MADELGTLILRIEADVKNLKAELGKVDTAVDDFTKTSKKNLVDFQKVAETALGFGLANLALNAANYFRNLAISTVVNTVKTNEAMDALRIQVGNTADSMVKSMRTASQGLVTDLELIQSANKALALGISKDDIPKLLEVATARSKLLGISASKAFEDITTGVARNSKQILDNLGIVVDLDKAYQDYAVSVGKTADSLTEAEKKQALINNTIEASIPLMEAMSLATDTLSTDLQQLKVDLQNSGSSLVNNVLHLDKYKEASDGLSTAFKILTENVGDKSWNVNARDAFIELGKQATDNEKKIMSLNSELSNTKKIMSDFKALFAGPFEGQAELESQLADVDVKVAELNAKKADINAKDDYGNQAATLMNQKYDEQLSKLQIQREQLIAHRDLELSKVNALEKSKKIELEKLVPQEKSLQNLKTSADSFLQNIESQKQELQLSKDLQVSYSKEAEELKNMTTQLTKQEFIARRLLLLSAATSAVIGGGSAMGAVIGLNKVFSQIDKVAMGVGNTGTSQTQSPMMSVIPNAGQQVVFNIGTLSSVNPEDTASQLFSILNSKVRG